jgi:hypothetical protein
LLLAFFGIVVKLEPEKRISAMTVYTHQSSRMCPEKAVGCIAFEKGDAFPFGVQVRIPLVDIMA